MSMSKKQSEKSLNKSVKESKKQEVTYFKCPKTRGDVTCNGFTEFD